MHNRIEDLVREYVLMAVMSTSATEDEGELEDLQDFASRKADEIIAGGRQVMDDYIDSQRF